MIDFWIDLLTILAPFGGPSWDPRVAQDGPQNAPKTPPRPPKSHKSTQDQHLVDVSKIVLWLQRGLEFSGSGGPSWEQKPIKDRSKSGVQDGMHLGIDF